MKIWGKIFAVVAAPLLLTGCLWGPGKFKSDLALNKNGTFVLDYRGEIMLQMPDTDPAPLSWNDDMAKCFVNGGAKVESDTVLVELDPPENTETEDREPAQERNCTASEISRLKADYEKQVAERVEKKRKENDEMAKLFGIPGSDDESNKRFAASLMKHRGWRSVVYKGKGLFEVDYHFEGRLTQDFAFPLMPDSDLMIPFITIRPRTDGSVRVTAPAFVGGTGVFGARAKMMGLPGKGNDGPVSRAEGHFTIMTDGEILTNNSEEGPVAVQGRRQLYWDVEPGNEKIPEALVRL
jgi:hypothetical protein